MERVGLILAVDDDESILDLVEMALEDEGYRVELARDGAEALDLLMTTRPELILLDMRMPRVNGWEFAQAYQRMPGPHVPIIVMTAGRDAREVASEIGATSHLGKPFDVETLVQVVGDCLRDQAA